MPKALLLIGFLALSGCNFQSVPHDAILGKWKSNAQLTLRSMNATEGLTTHSGFEPYEVLEVADSYVRIKAWSNFFQNYDERILYIEGSCYYEIFKHFRFRQYFCK
jgi:hypothetical protein